MSYVERVSDVMRHVEVIQIMLVVLNFQNMTHAMLNFQNMTHVMLKVQPIAFGVSLLLSQITFDDQIL